MLKVVGLCPWSRVLVCLLSIGLCLSIMFMHLCVCNSGETPTEGFGGVYLSVIFLFCERERRSESYLKFLFTLVSDSLFLFVSRVAFHSQTQFPRGLRLENMLSSISISGLENNNSPVRSAFWELLPLFCLPALLNLP